MNQNHFVFFQKSPKNMLVSWSKISFHAGFQSKKNTAAQDGCQVFNSNKHEIITIETVLQFELVKIWWGAANEIEKINWVIFWGFDLLVTIFFPTFLTKCWISLINLQQWIDCGAFHFQPLQWLLEEFFVFFSNLI